MQDNIYIYHGGEYEKHRNRFYDISIHLTLTHQISSKGLQLVSGQDFKVFMYPPSGYILQAWEVCFLINPDEDSVLRDLQFDYSYYNGTNLPGSIMFNDEETLESFSERVLESVGQIVFSVIPGENPRNENLFRIVADVPIVGDLIRIVIWEESHDSLQLLEVFSHVRKYFPNIEELYPEECRLMQNREKALRLNYEKEAETQ